jgi:hypothetical protein
MDKRQAIMRHDHDPFALERGGEALEQTSVVRTPGQAAILRPELPPDSYIEVSGATAILTGAEATLYIPWTDFGTVTAITLGVADVSQSDQFRGLSALALKWSVSPGDKSLTLDGTSAAFVRFSSIVGFDGLPKPIYRPIRQNDRWTFIIHNYGAGTWTPIIGFHFRSRASMKPIR